MTDKDNKTVVKKGFIKSRTVAVKTYFKQSLAQPISIKESKNWIASTSQSIRQLGKGRQLTWPEYSARMEFSSAKNVMKAYRNISILFYLCLVAFIVSLFELLYLIGSRIGGETLLLTSIVGTLLSMLIGVNLMIISSKELWMIYHEKVVNIHQWFEQLKVDPWSFFPASLDYQKALNLLSYSSYKNSNRE
ncbi:MAG: hypothetical protein Q9M92_10775 [Enterobacterales bacterium]|nr:hypothetical protein [Enterobacterales bacterium]